MGFRILESGKELANAQRALISAFRDARAEEKTINIGYHGGNHNLPAVACLCGRQATQRQKRLRTLLECIRNDRSGHFHFTFHRV